MPFKHNAAPYCTLYMRLLFNYNKYTLVFQDTAKKTDTTTVDFLKRSLQLIGSALVPINSITSDVGGFAHVLTSSDSLSDGNVAPYPLAYQLDKVLLSTTSSFSVCTANVIKQSVVFQSANDTCKICRPL